MTLPVQLRSARMTNATLGSSIDDNVGQLEKDLADLLGLPLDTDITNALFSGSAAGLLSIILQNASANPTLAGQLMRNNTRILWHNTERAVELQPAGEVKWFAGTSSPTGWLPCDGAAVSRATYARLFATIGIAFGAGDGSTTFNVPNLKSRTIVGQDAGDTDFDVIGDTGGAKQMSLAHTHALSGHTHVQQGTFLSGGVTAPPQTYQSGPSGNNLYEHGHNVTISGATQGPNVPDTGGASVAVGSVVQPYITLAPYITT